MRKTTESAEKQCIYCKNFKASKEFNREHIIPQAFGKFHPNSPTLKCVCKDCNKYFGGRLDQPFARDSFEGFQRQFFGIWPKEERKQKRVKTKVVGGGFSKNLIAKTRAGLDGEFETYAPSQVGIFNLEKQEYEYFEPCDLPTKDDLLKKYEMKEHPLDFRPQGNDPIEMLLKPFKERGLEITMTDEETVESDAGVTTTKTWIEATVVLDTTVMRALAKITFNYLAATAGEAFALNKNFDLIREYIRFGKHVDQEKYFFEPNQPPILSEERLLYSMGHNATTVQGHIIAVQWTNNGQDVIGRITFFNRNVYKLTLCKRFAGLWREIRSGHYFDAKTKRVIKLIKNPIDLVTVPRLGRAGATSI